MIAIFDRPYQECESSIENSLFLFFYNFFYGRRNGPQKPRKGHNFENDSNAYTCQNLITRRQALLVPCVFPHHFALWYSAIVSS